MKHLISKYIDHSNFNEISVLIDTFDKHVIDCVNWTAFSDKPKVEFSLAYSKDYLFLKYFVKEDYSIANTDFDNGPVWQDSCVEFFVSLDGGKNYYNFEFNCIGKCLLAYGAGRNNREFASDDILKSIIRIPSLPVQCFAETTLPEAWTLFVAIPLKAFFREMNQSINFENITANFYKCADGLSKPHYLSFFPIKTPQPDFHQPTYFEKIAFNF